ncbi:hypothetical protein [Aureimonas frigidaquae]|uniref:hypothetical protein n=1 Tax=Aureimonas frigidaquae TaxID=424757 RepID=UPI000785399F|nr:hypothetical protein [Aureimonas frigidaquae]
MQSRVADPAFVKLLEGFSSTTAEVLYRMPDHPDFLQSFLWQFEDLAPEFPRLHRFLDHWRAEVQATIHSVRVMHQGLIRPRELRIAAQYSVQ